MKIYITAVLLGVAGTVCLAADPVYQESFNNDRASSVASVELKNGAVLGPAGSGVSGQATDRSYNAELASDAAVTSPGPVACIRTPVPTPGLEEVTVAFWFKPGRFQVPASSLFNVTGLYLITDDQAGWVLRVEAETAEKVMYWFRTGTDGPNGPWINPGHWIFAAFTWSRAAGEVCMYQGNKTDEAQLVKCTKRKEAVGGLMTRANVKDRPDVIGNNLDPKYARPFNGAIDNFSIYAKALDAAAIEQIRQAHLKNLPSPAF